MLWIEEIKPEDCCRQCGAFTFDTCYKCGNCENCGHNCGNMATASYYAMRRRTTGEDIALEALSQAGFNYWSSHSPSIHYNQFNDHLYGDDFGIEERH